ncbi:MAG: glycoside hydrolase family 43 protein [Clostridia bacterium]|nr:glycoside hydrolase family 43 protein [Clostridia bacterium]
MLLKKSGGYESRDPFVLYENGRWYHLYTVGAEALYLSAADKPDGLLEAPGVCVFTPEAGTPYSCELWAPELHVLNGKCYIYVACDDGDNYHHRMYVLTNDSAAPQAPYRMLGKLSDASDKWAIDATLFSHRGQLYAVWSGWEGDENVCQDLYIAKMSDPCTVFSERVKISTPEYEWEKMDCDGVSLPFINEGPCVYEKEGVLRILYSASGSWANNYCIGILTLTGDDPMRADAWVKQPYPALSQADGFNGPGHCSVISDGMRDYIAFHVYDDGARKGWDHVHAVLSPFTIVNGKIVLEE